MAKYYMLTKEGRVIETENPRYWDDSTVLPKKEGHARYVAQTRADMLEYIKPGMRVHALIRHVSASGMSRRISLFVALTDDKGAPYIRDISWHASILTGHKLGREPGIIMSGCGMDMGFSLVYDLGRALWPDGTPEPHGMRNGEPDSCGGYALKKESL